jgi:hypothetical protein
MPSPVSTTSPMNSCLITSPFCTDHTPGNNFSISLSGDKTDEYELRGYWAKLSATGTVTMTLVPARGGRLRHVRRQVRHQLAGQYRRGLSRWPPRIG